MVLSGLLVPSCSYGQSVDLALTDISSKNEILALGDTTNLTVTISQNGPDDLPVGAARIWVSLDPSVARWITPERIVDNFGNAWTLVTANTSQIQLRNYNAVFKNGTSIQLRIPILGIKEGIISLTFASTVFGKGVSDRDGTNQGTSIILKVEKPFLESQSPELSRKEPLDTTLSGLDLKSDATYFYPNPVKGLLQIKGKTAGKIQLINNAGKVVYNSDHPSSEGIDTSELLDGVYLIRITYNDGSSITRKIVKQ